MPENEVHRDTDGLAAGSSGLAGRLVEFAARHRLLANLVIHNILFALALALAYLVRFDAGYPGEGGESTWFKELFLPWLPFFLVLKSLAFGWRKQFRGGWRYASIRDIFGILEASLLFLAVAYVLVVLGRDLPIWYGKVPLITQSKGVLVLDFLATVFLVCTARLGVRIYNEEMRPVSAEGLRRVLVVGAGNAAETLLREIYKMPEQRYRVVGLVDDDPNKQGIFLHGVSVLGTTNDIKEICEEHEVEEILIAIPSATQKRLREIIATCQGEKLQFQILPAMDALIDGRVTVNQVRKVRINDLLGREAVELDTQAVAGLLRGRRVLITGAGGSIGGEMCRQVCRFEPAQLILVEQAENSLFEITNELARTFPDIDARPVVCDIFDRQRVRNVFQRMRPEVVIHAAAHKHVPLMELNPCEAVKNNVFGTRNVADAACEYDADEFVMISTDKAVNPSSVMGCTKRVAEIYTQALNGRDGCRTRFKAVRFGNVLGSAGSVVPTFERQIREGGPVTVTHEDMTRYFMTIPEAAQLVLQAATTGAGGEIFLLDMGEPVRIVDLARDMITLSGLRVGEDIDIAITGARPGEKLFEELRTEGEDIAPTVHPKVKIWKHQPTDWHRIRQAMDGLWELANCPDWDPIVEALRQIVAEYTPMGPPADTPAAPKAP